MWASTALYTATLTGTLSTVHHLISNLCRCGNPSNDKSFFVGGINVLFQFQNVSESSDFVGTIRNLVIDSVQIDLSSPIREENTVPGTLFTSEPKCEEMEAVCSGPHYTGCLDYDTESRCICVGGFNSRACSEEKSKHHSQNVFMHHTISCTTYNTTQRLLSGIHIWHEIISGMDSSLNCRINILPAGWRVCNCR